MNWEEIKDKVYFEDGSLRDILIFDWAIEDWRKWTDLASSNYKLEFYKSMFKF